jgi:hypothetical protein
MLSAPLKGNCHLLGGHQKQQRFGELADFSSLSGSAPNFPE